MGTIAIVLSIIASILVIVQVILWMRAHGSAKPTKPRILPKSYQTDNSAHHSRCIVVVLGLGFLFAMVLLFNIGNLRHKWVMEARGFLVQDGHIPMKVGKLDVFYRQPYETPPQLEWARSPDEFELLEQRVDGFVIDVKKPSKFTYCIWTATGTPASHSPATTRHK